MTIMNPTLFKATVRLSGAAALAMVATFASAQTSTLTVHGQANCFDLTPGANGGNVAAQMELQAGSYTVKVKSTDIAFCSGGRCLQPAVALNLWGGNSYYEPLLVKPGSKKGFVLLNGGTLYAHVMDNPCGDNSGTTVLAITKTE